MILSWGLYTRDIEAMMLNNLGAAYIEKAELPNAEKYLKNAIDIDPLYPMPFYGLAIVAHMQGNRDKAIKLLEESEKKGFTNSSIDHLIQKSIEILAKIEGRADSKPKI